MHSSIWPTTSCGTWQILPIASQLFKVRYQCLKREYVDTDHGDLIIVHLYCLWHFITEIYTLFGLFILGYFINIDYGYIACDKGACIRERGVLSFNIRVLILHRKRTFHSAMRSVNDSHCLHTIIPCTMQLISYFFIHRLSSYPNFNGSNMQRNSQLAAIIKCYAHSSKIRS